MSLLKAYVLSLVVLLNFGLLGSDGFSSAQNFEADQINYLEHIVNTLQSDSIGKDFIIRSFADHQKLCKVQVYFSDAENQWMIPARQAWLLAHEWLGEEFSEAVPLLADLNRVATLKGARHFADISHTELSQQIGSHLKSLYFLEQASLKQKKKEKEESILKNQRLHQQNQTRLYLAELHKKEEEYANYLFQLNEAISEYNQEMKAVVKLSNSKAKEFFNISNSSSGLDPHKLRLPISLLNLALMAYFPLKAYMFCEWERYDHCPSALWDEAGMFDALHFMAFAGLNWMTFRDDRMYLKLKLLDDQIPTWLRFGLAERDLPEDAIRLVMEAFHDREEPVNAGELISGVENFIHLVRICDFEIMHSYMTGGEKDSLERSLRYMLLKQKLSSQPLLKKQAPMLAHELLKFILKDGEDRKFHNINRIYFDEKEALLKAEFSTFTLQCENRLCIKDPIERGQTSDFLSHKSPLQRKVKSLFKAVVHADNKIHAQKVN